MEKSKWYKNPEMIVALSALLIGIVTAFTSIYSANIDRQYARSSVWPRLELYKSLPENTFSYGVINSGMGPALIKYVTVKYDSKYIKHWSDIDLFKDIMQSHLSGRTLASQKTITPVLYKGKDARSLLKADELIDIELCYCSIYEECWVINGNNQAKLVEECSVDNKHRFLQ